MPRATAQHRVWFDYDPAGLKSSTTGPATRRPHLTSVRAPQSSPKMWRLQGKIAIPTQMLLTSPRESAISAPPLAESSNNSGFLLNGAWSNAARIAYVSRRLARYRRYSPIKKEVLMAKATQTTVTLKHLAATLAGTHEMAKKQSETILGDFVGLVVKHLKKGDRIRIGGLGILQVRKRAARMGRNPATGEPIKIKASKKVAFRAAKELKEAV